jgi:hypothetical protein
VEEADYINSYAIDLFQNLRANEHKTMCKSPLEYHQGISKSFRGHLIDWMIGFSKSQEIMADENVLLQAITLMNRYL